MKSSNIQKYKLQWSEAIFWLIFDHLGWFMQQQRRNWDPHSTRGVPWAKNWKSRFRSDRSNKLRKGRAHLITHYSRSTGSSPSALAWVELWLVNKLLLYCLGQNPAAEKNVDASWFWDIFWKCQKKCRQIIGTSRRSIFHAPRSSQMPCTAKI